MSVTYKAVGWNRQKKIYDLTVAGGIVLYLAVFVAIGAWARPNATIETLLIRGFGTAALLLLNVVLAIGPLARIDPRFLPLLYNRRHLGVMLFIVALVHGIFAIVQYHGLGVENPLVSVLISNTRYDSLAHFPFQPLGLAALLILFLMAATSHDFWLKNLSPAAWKLLHMAVYAAYALVVLHVALGTLQAQSGSTHGVLLAFGMVTIVYLHLWVGWREQRLDRRYRGTAKDGLIRLCRSEEIPENRARIFTVAGERVAVFRYDGRIAAIANACRHQNGPLGEGRVVNGCVVCPWHGYEYHPHDGRSPAPFTEKVPTFAVRVVDGEVWIDPTPYPAGTAQTPARYESSTAAEEDSGFYIGYKPQAPPAIARHTRTAAVALLAAGVSIAAILAATQERFDAAYFEFGNPVPVRGTVRADPYPILAVSQPGSEAPVGQHSRYLLVGFGKRGAEAEVEGLANQAVETQGTLIHRDATTALELVAESTQVSEAHTTGDTPPKSLGVHTLVGEIVDSKCYLGVMRPGRGKPHRACAVSCIRGGIPPALLVEDRDGRREVLLLVDDEYRQVGKKVLDLVGEPVEIQGEVIQRDNLLYLKSDPHDYRRLEDPSP